MPGEKGGGKALGKRIASLLPDAPCVPGAGAKRLGRLHGIFI